MLEFKQRQSEPDELHPRWSIGVDRRQVAAYVGLALIAGFAAGFIVSRSLSRKEQTTLPPIADNRPAPRQPALDATVGEYHRVNRILRADTIDLEGTGPVRLIGIETPDGKAPKEIYGVHGQRALSFIERLLAGQDVRVEYDAPGSGPGKDDSGQTLAYVYTRDGTLVNGEMVKQGLAFVHGTEFRFANDFRGFERDAMQSMRGVWGSSSSSSTLATAPAPSPVPAPIDDKAKKLSPLAPSAFGANIPALSGSPSNPAEPSVWVSTGDKLYHKSGCEFLDKKKRSVALSQAKSEGFTACSRCFASTVMKAP
jgi:endonuclease YncB( thermonuclease family)